MTDHTRCTCNSLPKGHTATALHNAFNEGCRAARRGCGSSYRFCNQLQDAWGDGYKAERAASKEA